MRLIKNGCFRNSVIFTMFLNLQQLELCVFARESGYFQIVQLVKMAVMALNPRQVNGEKESENGF